MKTAIIILSTSAVLTQSCDIKAVRNENRHKSAAKLTPFKYVCTAKHNDTEMLKDSEGNQMGHQNVNHFSFYLIQTDILHNCNHTGIENLMIIIIL